LTITVWPSASFDQLNEDILRTVNYSAIADATQNVARRDSFKLIETLGGRLAAHLLATFPIQKVEIEVRKFVLPQAKFVSVNLTRETSRA
jgi:dihydroneopterin aldolase